MLHRNIILSGVFLLFIISITAVIISDKAIHKDTMIGKATNPILTKNSAEGQTPLTSTGTTTYLYGHKLIAKKSQSGTTYNFQDIIGSNTITTNQAGILQSRFTSYPYGKALTKESTSGGVQKYTFTGKEDDGRLMYYGARYFDPMIGRFISTDPAQASDASYDYANGNPLKYVDPTGTSPHVPLGGYIDGWEFIGKYPRSSFSILKSWIRGNPIKPQARHDILAYVSDKYKENNPQAYKYWSMYFNPEILQNARRATYPADKGDEVGRTYPVYDATEDFNANGFDPEKFISYAALNAINPEKILEIYNNGGEAWVGSFLVDDPYVAPNLDQNALKYVGFYIRKGEDNQPQLILRDKYDWEVTDHNRGTFFPLHSILRTNVPSGIMKLFPGVEAGKDSTGTYGVRSTHASTGGIGAEYIISGKWQLSKESVSTAFSKESLSPFRM